MLKFVMVDTDGTGGSCLIGEVEVSIARIMSAMSNTWVGTLRLEEDLEEQLDPQGVPLSVHYPELAKRG